MLIADAVVWPGALTLHWHHRGVFPCRPYTWLNFLQPTISHGKVWSLSSMGHEMPLAGDPWLLRQVFCGHGPSHSHDGVSGWRGTLRHAGHSAWCSALAAGNAAWQALGPGWRFLSWWCPGTCTAHTVCEVWCPPDGKSCCAIWGTAMPHWVLQQLHNICGWGMWYCSVLRVHQQFSKCS